MHIDKSELWLFPYQIVTNAEQGAVRLTFRVTAQSFTSKKKTTVTYAWNTHDSCMPLDITILMKRLLKKKKNAQDISKILMTIETTHIEVAEHNGQENQQLKAACEAMASRGCNTPFLVYQHNSALTIPDTLTLPDVVDLRPRPEAGEERRNRREVVRTNETEGITNCSLQPLLINLNKVLPNQAILPTDVDIGTCRGGCSSPEQAPDTVRSQIIKVSGLDPQSCCVPSAYSPLYMLLYSSDDILSLHSLTDVIVTGCSCVDL